MRRTADVRSIDALKDAKAALIEFREIAVVALSEAQAEVQRTVWWLQNDQTTHWKHEVRRRTELVNQARSDLYRAKLAAMDETAQCIEQKKALERAEHRLREAERKVQLVKQWSQKVDREAMLFRAQIQGISRAAESDLPRAEAKLEIMLDRLEAYVRLPPPQSGDAAARRGGASEDAGPGEDEAGGEKGSSPP
jgi:hypothetical protein